MFSFTISVSYSVHEHYHYSSEIAVGDDLYCQVERAT